MAMVGADEIRSHLEVERHYQQLNLQYLSLLLVKVEFSSVTRLLTRLNQPK